LPHVIAAACVDVMDRSCVEECPVDCIYEGARKLYVNPVGPLGVDTMFVAGFEAP
jgi:NAD-dependent dihydropyrimidine dehydrogenase PreA subunit